MIEHIMSPTPEARIWRALFPALCLAAWFLLGLVVYWIRSRKHGRFRDADVESRGDSILLGMWVRQYFLWVTRPAWLLIAGSGIPANSITTLSALLGLGSGIAFAAGHFALGGWLYIFSGSLDVFDGRLARLHNTSGPRGAVLDSVLDRYVDAAVLSGLAWFYRDSWVLVFVLLALAGSFLVSYVRARGEGVGVQVRVGLMQRPERIVFLGALTAMSPVLAAIQSPNDPSAPHWLAIAGIVFLAISTQWTAARRFLHVLGHLEPARRRWLSTARDGVARAIVTAGLATSADFLATLALVERVGMLPWVATGAGCVVGAIVGFTIARTWAFTDGGKGWRAQFGRYLFASGTGLMLNSGGVFVLLLLPDTDYRIAWVIVRALVFLFWSYPLHRDYVFENGVGRLNPDLRSSFDTQHPA